MKRKLFLLSATLLFMCTVFPAFSQERTLQEGDVEKFVETFDPIQEELEALDYSFEVGDNGLSVTEGITLNNKVLTILDKHGWNESYFEKAAVIAAVYASIRLQEEIAQANPEMKQALEEIDQNEYLSAEMKVQMREQILAVFAVMEESSALTVSEMHPEDVELVRRHKEELYQLFE